MFVSVKNKLSEQEAAIALMYEIISKIESGNINQRAYVYVVNDADLVYVRIEFRCDDKKYDKYFMQFLKTYEKYTLAQVKTYVNGLLLSIYAAGYMGIPKNA